MRRKTKVWLSYVNINVSKRRGLLGQKWTKRPWLVNVGEEQMVRCVLS